MSDSGANDWRYDATILKVKDGDTVVAQVDLGFSTHLIQTFRLIGINSPEKTGKTKLLGEQATRYLIDKVEGKRVIIETHRDAMEKYGRFLATIWLDGVNVNKLMVESGNAVEYWGGKRE